MKASTSDVLKFLSKGLKVIDKSTGVELTEDIINQSIGVSDGMIDIGWWLYKTQWYLITYDYYFHIRDIYYLNDYSSLYHRLFVIYTF